MNTRFARVAGVVALGVLLSVSAVGGPTVITPPNNKYTPAQDVELPAGPRAFTGPRI